MNTAGNVEQLKRRLGLQYADADLLRQALQHPSYVRELDRPATESNQRLEFLGDAVLDLILADHLWRTQPDLTEGALTKLKSMLVREESLATVGRRLGLGEFLLLGRGEEDTGGRDKASLLADCVEAVIAVVYLSAGLAAARGFVLAHFAGIIENVLARGPTDDAKTRLQELLQQRTRQAPEYVTVAEEGPPHDPCFLAECRFRGILIGKAWGKTKREAEQQAAALALADMDMVWRVVEEACAEE